MRKIPKGLIILVVVLGLGLVIYMYKVRTPEQKRPIPQPSPTSGVYGERDEDGRPKPGQTCKLWELAGRYEWVRERLGTIEMTVIPRSYGVYIVTNYYGNDLRFTRVNCEGVPMLEAKVETRDTGSTPDLALTHCDGTLTNSQWDKQRLRAGESSNFFYLDLDGTEQKLVGTVGVRRAPFQDRTGYQSCGREWTSAQQIMREGRKIN